MPIDILYDDRAVVGALSRLQRATGDLSPAMRDIAAALEDGIGEAFESETAPDGTPWADLSEHTIRRRTRQGKWPGRKLRVSGSLAGSRSSGYDANPPTPASVLGTRALTSSGRAYPRAGGGTHPRPTWRRRHAAYPRAGGEPTIRASGHDTLVVSLGCGMSRKRPEGRRTRPVP